VPKRIRGRYEIVVPLTDGGSLKIDTRPNVYLTPQQIVTALRKHADQIEAMFKLAPPAAATEQPPT